MYVAAPATCLMLAPDTLNDNAHTAKVVAYRVGDHGARDLLDTHVLLA
jgi:hypothetical protein